MLKVQRRTSLALANLMYQPTRTAISIGGVSFAVLLMLMQLGFLGTVSVTATGVYDRLTFDLLVRSPEYLHLFESRNIPESLWHQVAQVPGVGEVRLLDVALGKWQSPVDGKFRAMGMLGVDPKRPAIDLPELRSQLPLLENPDYVLIDQTSRPEYGPRDEQMFGEADIGSKTDLLGREVTIGGLYRLGTGLAASGALMISRTGFAERLTFQRDRVSLILVRTQPGEDPRKVASAVREQLKAAGHQHAAEVLTRAEVQKRELRRWVWDTPIGLIFVSGVVLAAVVGAMICYMVLATDVMGRLPEYATLKAMGYPNPYLYLVVMQQAWWLAGAAVVITTPLAWVVYRITSVLAGVSIDMTLGRMVLVACLTMLACTFAALMALRKLARAEPASLF